MKHVSTLTADERSALTQMYEQGYTHRLRQRAHAILLSSQGYTREHLALLFTVHVDTVSRWLDNWIQDGLAGLADAPKSGRPRKITPQLEDTLREILEQPTPQLRALVEAELQKKTSTLRGRR